MAKASLLLLSSTAAEARPLIEAAAARGRAALAAATFSGFTPAARLLVQCHSLQALAQDHTRCT